jgi:hypothetical protein
MSFTRSKSGISNYAFFFNCELIVFTEGVINDSICYDVKYYSALISKITQKKEIKIKPIGNRDDVLKYFEQIASSELNNSIAIIDKDMIGISSSIIEHKKLFITHGYSWENDFWSKKLCQEIINRIAFGDNDANEGIEKSYNFTLRRVAKICAFDMAFQVDGKSLIPKNGRSCGIDFTAKEPIFVSHKEFRRHATKFKNQQYYLNGSISNIVYKIAQTQAPYKLIQGHLWENLCIAIISRYYKKVTKSKSAPLDFIKNIAFSAFSVDPIYFISNECHEHFKNQFSRLEL